MQEQELATANTPIGSVSAKHQWSDLQWRQELHDRLFHSDVYMMDRKDRLTHLVLHLAKYNGRYYEARGLVDDAMNRKVTVDACIVLVSILNALNHPLQDTEREVHNSGAGERLVMHTAELCKLLEGLDHMEAVDNFRLRFIGSTICLLRCWFWNFEELCRRAMYNDAHERAGFDELYRVYQARLTEVERKNIFFDEILATHPELPVHEPIL